MFTPDALPEPLSAVLVQVRAWSGDDAREQLQGAGAPSRAAWVAGLQQLADAVAAASLTAVEVFDACGDGQVLHGAASTTAWLRGAARLTGAQAAERVRIARLSRELLAGPVQQVAAGTLTYEHLRAVERGVRHLPPAHQQQGVQLLTELAGQAPVGDVRTAGQHLQAVLDPDGSLAHTEQQFDRRYLTLSPLMDGMTALDGLLDAEAAALLTAALKPHLVPAGPDDTRNAPQRRADGLMQIVQTAADHHLLPVVGAERPHLHVVVDPRTTAATDPTQPATPAPLPPGRLPQTPGAPALLHPVGVARTACDAQLTPLLLDPHGTVTDLGRTRRLFSPQQRRLLAARDGGCRFPGCDRPPAHTDAHHVVSWLHGGPTDTDNALLLCRYHHRQVHEGRWHITIVDTTRGTHGPITFHGPHQQHLTSHPRGP